MRPVVPAIASVLTLAFALTLAPPAAHADENAALPGSSAGDSGSATVRVYYGWQNLGADSASVGLLLLAAGGDHGDRDGLVYAGLGGYLLGSPLVHAFHGHYRRAAGSLALRAGLPLAFGLATGALIGGSSEGGTLADGVALGQVSLAMGAVGAVIAVFADDVGLSWDEKPAPRSWAPTVQPSPYGMTFGVAGTF
jgi:hypothetical protein